MNGKRILTSVFAGLVCSLLLTQAACAEVSHPRVMFGRKDIPALRAKIEKEPWASWYKQVKERADSAMETATAEITGFNARWSSVALGFAYTIEGDKKYALKARDILLAMPSEVIHSRKTNAIHRSYSGASYPLAYDMIYNALTAKEREQVEERIRTALISMVTLARTQYNGNIRSCYAAALGIMGLALNEKAWIDQARTAMEGVLNNCIKGAGAFNEGQAYSGMGIGELYQLMFALGRQPGEKNYFQHPQTKKFLDFCVLCSSPIATFPCFEDSGYRDSGISMLVHASGQLPAPEHSKVYNWLKERSQAYGRGSGRHGSIDNILLKLMIIDRVETEVEQPWEVSGVYPRAGLAFLRSGWDPEALYLAISCKTYNSGPHCHGDENSIELWAYGAYILANAGYPGWENKRHWECAVTEASNAILINGKGQLRRRCSARPADGFGGSLLTDFVDYVEARGSKLYADGGFNRNVLFVKPTATVPGYYILIDKIKTTKADSPIDWVLHGRGSMKTGRQSATWTVKSFVTKKPVTLTARIITPQVKITGGGWYNAMAGKDIPYIRTRCDRPATFVTVLYPTKQGQKVPEIKNLAGAKGATVGGTDLIFSREGDDNRKVGEVETDGSICFIRKGQGGLDYFFVTGARYLKFKDKPVFNSKHAVTVGLQYTEAGFSGVIDAAAGTSVSIPLTKRPTVVGLNGKNTPITYAKGVWTLKLKKGRNSISMISNLDTY